MLTPESLRLEKKGLLIIGSGCDLDDTCIFRVADLTGVEHPIRLGDRCRVGSGAIVHGGSTIASDATVEDGVIVGKPEYGVAIRVFHDGSGLPTTIGPGSIVRAGAIVYGGVTIGENTTIGHRTILRTSVTIGGNSQLAHGITVERECRIGNSVRCSPLSHFTGSVVLEDSVFVGALVATINDKEMIWKNPDKLAELVPPYFEFGARVGSGSTILAGVRIGHESLVGAGSVVTRDVPPFAVVYGSPARVHGQREA